MGKVRPPRDYKATMAPPGSSLPNTLAIWLHVMPTMAATFNAKAVTEGIGFMGILSRGRLKGAGAVKEAHLL